MFLSLSNFFDDESSSIQVDSSVIDVSEFKDEADQNFLIIQGHELLRINAKAEHAKEQICKAIDQKASDAKGKILYDIQERFRNTPELKGGLMKYFHSLGFWETKMKRMGLEQPENPTSLNTAFRWANCYRAALEMQTKLAGELPAEQIQERANSMSEGALAKIYTSCSEADREELYRKIATGEKITAEQANEISKRPETKLSKAEELLSAARLRKQEAEERWEEVKADESVNYKDPEYSDRSRDRSVAVMAVDSWETKVADLQAQVDAKEAELNKFKFDEDVQRQTRIKVLTDALTVGVPQTTADLNKFIRDAEYYDPEVRRHFDHQIKVLADMCGDYLSRL